MEGKTLLRLLSKAEIGHVPSSSSIKGKGYEPSQYQVDHLYDSMMGADKLFDRWHGVDKKLLLQKLQAKIREEHPDLSPANPDADADADADEQQQDDDDGVGDIVAVSSPSPPSKRRNVNGGPIIIHGLRVPKDVVAHMVPYCGHRGIIINLGLTCRGVYQVIHDQRLVKHLPWPSKCPLSSLSYREYFVASIATSRIAIIREKEREDMSIFHLEIWDRFHGLMGELEWKEITDKINWKPIFFPDNELVIVPHTVGEYEYNAKRGFRAVQIPFGTDKQPIITSDHFLTGTPIDILAFVNNDMIIVGLDSSSRDFELWKIDRVSGRISFTFLRRILVYEQVITWKIAPFSWNETKTILAMPLYDEEENRVLFYDLFAKKSLSKSLPTEGELFDMAFSPDGKLVFSIGHLARNCGSLLICDCTTIAEIGDPKVICSIDNCCFTNIIAFSADGSKVAMESEVTKSNDGVLDSLVGRNFLIDWKRGEVLSDSFLKDGDQSVWDTFVN